MVASIHRDHSLWEIENHDRGVADRVESTKVHLSVGVNGLLVPAWDRWAPVDGARKGHPVASNTGALNFGAGVKVRANCSLCSSRGVILLVMA